MAPRDGKIDPIQPGFIRNVIAGVRTVVSGVNPNNWFGPGQPMVPTAPEEVKGRAFDYQPGWNLHTRPRQDEAISFDQLRALADSYDLLRLVIETRKDQISKLDWTIQPRKPSGGVDRPKADGRVDEITRLLRRLDGINSWQNWLRMLMEDSFFLDAATIFPRFNRSGDLHVIEVIDGSTRRGAKYEFVGDGAAEIPTANVSHRFVKGSMTGEISRNFYRDKAGDLIASHDGLVINGEGKGGGIGKQVLRTQFDEYDQIGIKKVKVHAKIDVGGYAWAKFGFVPTQWSWNELRASMQTWINSDTVLSDDLGNDYQPLKIPKRQRAALTKILDNPDPKGIWKIADARHRNRNLGKEILMERDWEGEIRLDDTDAMARFNHYTGRSK